MPSGGVVDGSKGVGVANGAAGLGWVKPLGVVCGVDGVGGEGAQRVALEVEGGAALDVAILQTRVSTGHVRDDLGRTRINICTQIHFNHRP